MTRKPRPKINWGSGHKPEPRSRGELPAPPDYLGTWRWRQPGAYERLEDWLARTKQQRELVQKQASNWLRVGQQVKVHADARLGGGDIAGRVGTIHRLCGPVFADYVAVFVPPKGRETVPRVRMLPLEIIEPAD